MLKQAAKDWEKIKDSIPDIVEAMGPLIKKNGVVIRAQIAAYRATLEVFKKKVTDGNGFKFYSVGWAAALQKIQVYLCVVLCTNPAKTLIVGQA